MKRLDLAQSTGLRISQQMKAIKLEAQHFPPGEKIAGRYELREMIGKGPFGEVYRATDNEIDADVAVKIFDREVIRNLKDEDNFRRVTRGARSMTQQNVVRVHDSGLHKKHPWVSMQLLEGLSLRKVLDLRKTKNENFELDEVEPVLAQITLALQHVARDFPHGDLKPENIIFLPNLIKVTDSFVFAALPAESIIDRVKESAYLAPELHTAKTDPDARTDVYSLGVLIGEMLFGPDYTPGTQSTGEFAAVDGLLKRATAFDPNERHPSVEALAEDFAAVFDTGVGMDPSDVEEVPPPPPPKGPPPARRMPPPPPLDPESSKPTEEYKRDVDDIDIENHVLTTEVQRGHLPPPRREETASVRGSAASATAAVKAPRKGNDDIGAGKVVGSLVAALAVLALVLYIITNNDDPEEIGQTEVATDVVGKSDPTPTKAVSDVPAEPVTPSPEQAMAAQNSAATVVQNSGAAAVAAAMPSTTNGATNGAEVPAAAVTPEPPEKKATTESTKATTPQKSEKVAAKKEDEAKPKGTECPSGSKLVKSKNGNYCVDTYEYPGGGATPRTGVTWFEAKKSCESKGKRLCSLSEWRGACGSKYPYGSSFDADKCNTADEDGFERSLGKTGAFKQCRSRRSGAYDMVGNAHEWVAEQRIAGGGFESDESVGSCRYSSPKSPTSTAGYIGFRCCADPE